MSGVYKLLEHFPNLGFTQSNINSYNGELIQEMERIRDFIVLHYCLTERTDTPFWPYCRSMALPDSLADRIELYRRTGRIRVKPGELFTDLSWFYIFEGLGVRPETYDPFLDVVTLPQLRDILSSMATATDAAAARRPLARQPLRRRIGRKMTASKPLLGGVELGGTKCVCLLGSGPETSEFELSCRPVMTRNDLDRIERFCATPSPPRPDSRAGYRLVRPG